MITLLPAPTIATIDENYNLTANWQPTPESGSYSAYSGWNITLYTPPTNLTGITNFVANTGSFVFTAELSAGDYAMNMYAVAAAGSPPVYSNSPSWDSNHTFPTSLLAANVSFDNTNLLLGQTFTITLADTYAGANSWQIIYPDGSSTGWLPLTTRSVAKSLNIAGSLNVIIQTQNSFPTANPPVNLRRQLTQQIYVVDQQYNPGSSTQGVLTGTLGIGGNIEFEITNALAGATPQPYEVIVRSIARDMVTNELKLMVATSRYSNASSLLSTMAIDAFPMAGRPHAKELIEPIYVLEVTSATSAIPVSITTTTLPSNVFVGKPMIEFPMAATGGTPNYSWFSTGLPPGLKMNTSGIISGTPTQLGTFNTTFAVMDSSNPAFIAETTLTFIIPTDLVITTVPPLPNAQVGVPYSFTFTNTGGLAPYTWSIVAPQVPVGLQLDTTNSAILEGVPCTYTSLFPNSDYTETFSFVIQVTDAINSKSSLNCSMKLVPAPLTVGVADQYTISASEQYKLAVPVFGGRYPYTVTASGANLDASVPSTPVEGQIEFLVTPSTSSVNLINTFTVGVTDSSSPQQSVNKLINYAVKQVVSTVQLTDAFFDNYWDSTDPAAVLNLVEGSLSGFSIQSSSTVLSDGLTLAVTGSVIPPNVTITGPATTFLNTQVPVRLPILQGSSVVVATITREFTLLTHDGVTAGSPPFENIGVAQCFTHPFVVGDLVGLNPLKPWFNSPSLTPVTVTGLNSRVQTGSSLPPGLSLDFNTTLIYGTLLGVLPSQSSVIEYVDSNGVVQGTITIAWDITKTAFIPTDGIIDGQLGSPIASGASIISAPNITTCTVYPSSRTLPAGLSLLIDSSGDFVSIVGTPTEAGYFDTWFRLTNSSGQVGLLYHRIFIQYINPLVILTSSLPGAVVGDTYSFTMQGFGGIPISPSAPYTWAVTGLPSWLTLNSSTGLLSSGITVVPSGGGPFSLAFTITDARGVTAHATLSLAVINAVTITTAVLPIAEIGVAYTFAMAAVGGTTPYAWSWTSSSLPAGFSISTGGVITGTATGVISTTVNIKVTDSTLPLNGTDSVLYTFQTGAQGGLYINDAAVGPINRGAPYLGTLQALGTVAGVPSLPVSWSVTGVNPLPTGLILQANSADQGSTAIISGSYTGVLTSFPVVITATDNLGNSASITVLLSTDSSLAITTTSLPQGIVSVAYTPFQLTATGYNTPFTWSVVSSTPTSFPYLLSPSGVISGTSATAFNGSVTFQVSDSLSPADTAQKTLGLIVSSSSLTITTSSPLPSGTAGVSYTTPMAASGGVTPYTWSVSPLSTNPLPSGLTISTGGIISGTTSTVGTTNPITIRVTDNVGSVFDKAFSLTINSGLTLHTGIDYTDSISTNYLGYVDDGSTANINPRTNYSFYVIATGVITTSSSTLQSGITLSISGFSATVSSLSGGVARILISGPFATAGSVGDNTLGIRVVDTGITASASFKWKIYSDGNLVATATNAFPTQLVSA